MAAAGQLPGVSAAENRASHFAHERGHVRALGDCGPRFRYLGRMDLARCWNGTSTVGISIGIAGTSTIGTTPRLGYRLRHATFRRPTTAIWRRRFSRRKKDSTTCRDAPVLGPLMAEESWKAFAWSKTLAGLQPRGARFVSPALDALESRLVALRKWPQPGRRHESAGSWAVELGQEAERLPELLDGVQKSLRLQSHRVLDQSQVAESHIAGIRRDADCLLAWMRLHEPPAAWPVIQLRGRVARRPLRNCCNVFGDAQLEHGFVALSQETRLR